MNPESQVTSPEHSVKLKELGIAQQSLFYYFDIYGKGKYYLYFNESMPEEGEYEGEVFSAFTVAELLSILPYRIIIKENEPYNSFRFRMQKGIWCKDKITDPDNIRYTEFYSVNYYCDTTSQKMDWMFTSLTANISDENAANALAEMLVYLFENKYMTVS